MTFERSLVIVRASVSNQGVLVSKGGWTLVALIGLFTSVPSHVASEVTLPKKRRVALWTLVRLDTCMPFQVSPQVGFL